MHFSFIGKAQFRQATLILFREIKNFDPSLSFIFIAPLWKSGGYIGFALSFRHSVTFQMKLGISLRPVGQSWSNFIWSIIGIGKRLPRYLAGWIKTLVSLATENADWLIMGIMMFPPFLFDFDEIFFKLKGNKDRHKISDEFQSLARSDHSLRS